MQDACGALSYIIKDFDGSHKPLPLYMKHRKLVDKRLNATAWSIGVGLRLPQTQFTRQLLAEPGFPLVKIPSYDSVDMPELASEVADARALEGLAKRTRLVADRKAMKLRKRYARNPRRVWRRFLPPENLNITPAH